MLLSTLTSDYFQPTAESNSKWPFSSLISVLVNCQHYNVTTITTTSSTTSTTATIVSINTPDTSTLGALLSIYSIHLIPDLSYSSVNVGTIFD